MNINHLRHSLKVKWLLYYQKNRPWLVKLQIWGVYDGQRRPASSFILATLSNLEPELIQLFPFIIALSNNPDQIVAALGLNFDPDQELKTVTAERMGCGFLPSELSKAEPIIGTPVNGNGNGGTEIAVTKTNTQGNGLAMQMLLTTATKQPEANGESMLAVANPAEVVAPPQALEEKLHASQATNLPSWMDESCAGKGSPDVGVVLSVLIAIGSLAVVVIGLNG